MEIYPFCTAWPAWQSRSASPKAIHFVESFEAILNPAESANTTLLHTMRPKHGCSQKQSGK